MNKKIIIGVIVGIVIALAVLNLTYKDGPEPDAVYPMINQQIEWQYAGK